jgi:DNA-binding transcriptional MerR regulator
MAHEIAKLMLEHAGTFLQRAEAIQVATYLGMPLNEIEEYLDWLDATRGPLPADPKQEEPKGD